MIRLEVCLKQRCFLVVASLAENPSENCERASCNDLATVLRDEDQMCVESENNVASSEQVRFISHVPRDTRLSEARGRVFWQ